MADVINLEDFRPPTRDRVAQGIDVVPVPLNQSRLVVVCVNRDLEISEQRSFTSMGKAMHYAAALSAKHGVPIFPHGAADEFLTAKLER